MFSRNYKRLVMPQNSMKALQAHLQAISPKKFPGNYSYLFLPSGHNSPLVMDGRFVYNEVKRVLSLDMQTMEMVAQPVEVNTFTNLHVSVPKEIAYVEGKRGHFSAIYEIFDGVEDVHVAFEDFTLDLAEMYTTIAADYPKHEVVSFRLKDYLARENMLSSGTFKVLDKVDGEKLLDRFSDQLQAITLKIKLPDGVCKLSINRKGGIAVSDGFENLMDYVQGLLHEFHTEEVETETVVVSGAR